MGDSFGAGIVEHLSRNDLEEFDRLNAEENGGTDSELDVICPAYEKSDEGLSNPGFVNGDAVGSRL